MKKAIVTGGAGFIASHVVDALVERGVSVLVIDDLSSGSEENLSDAKQNGAVELLVADIADSSLENKFQEFQPDAVFHLAAQIDVRKSVSDPVFDGEKNVIATVNLLEAATASNTKQFIFASTGGAIYGEQEEYPAPESHTTKPEAPYGASKRAAEVYLEYYSRIHDMSVTSLRFSNVYGPRQNPHGEAGVVAIFSERFYSETPIWIFGDGMQTRDYVYVGDVVAANMAVYENPKTGFSVYNVGTGIEKTVIDIVDVIKTVNQEDNLGKEIVVEHKPERPGEQRRSVIDPTKLASELNCKATVTFEEGMAKTIRSFSPSNA